MVCIYIMLYGKYPFNINKVQNKKNRKIKDFNYKLEYGSDDIKNFISSVFNLKK